MEKNEPAQLKSTPIMVEIKPRSLNCPKESRFDSHRIKNLDPMLSMRYPFGVRRDFLFWGGAEIPVKRDQDLEHVEQVKYNIDRARSKAAQLREMGLMHKIPV